jgi:hypothetical protein
MRLNPEEQAMLAGDLGSGVQKAMEILTALGTIYAAEDLVPVTSVQVAGVSYKNLGEAGLEFLVEWAAQGARVRVPTTLNPAGLDLERWGELGFDAEFAERQTRVIQAFAAMGIRATCTCTPYFVGNLQRCQLCQQCIGGTYQSGGRSQRAGGGHHGPHPSLWAAPFGEPPCPIGRRGALPPPFFCRLRRTGGHGRPDSAQSRTLF